VVVSRDANAPADTRMMGIVHDALRRDLHRAMRALSTTPYPEDAQRRAIGEHVSWMMQFLHAHHEGEDAGLWPLVRARNPRAVPLLEAMEADHARIASLIDEADTAGRGYASDASDTARAGVLDALVRLSEVLLPHLEREEDEMMPLVSVSISHAEWQDVDQRYFIKPKSLAQLGLEGHWLLDGVDAEARQIVVHQVPPIPRFVLVHGFATRYRRRATACWGPDRSARRRWAYGPAAALPRNIARSGQVEALVDASIDAVWRVVADVTRVGEWSHECRRVEWLDGATTAAPGVRFRGVNKAGPWSWSRINEIIVADEPHTLVWRTIPTRLYPDSSEWRITLAPADGRTRIMQSFRVLRAPVVLARLYSIAIPAHRDRTTSLTDDLRRLGEIAATETRTEHTPV
jgi:hemerythrin-like domain-containing protein